MSTATRTAPVIQARRLTLGYQRSPVVREVNLAVGAGEIVALVGLNGAGKTTIMRALAGELRPFGGQVLWQSRPIAGPTFQRVRDGLAYVP